MLWVIAEGNFLEEGESKNDYYNSNKRNPYKEGAGYFRKYTKGSTFITDKCNMKDIFYYGDRISGLEIFQDNEFGQLVNNQQW